MCTESEVKRACIFPSLDWLFTKGFGKSDCLTKLREWLAVFFLFYMLWWRGWVYPLCGRCLCFWSGSERICAAESMIWWQRFFCLGCWSFAGTLYIFWMRDFYFPLEPFWGFFCYFLFCKVYRNAGYGFWKGYMPVWRFKCFFFRLLYISSLRSRAIPSF